MLDRLTWLSLEVHRLDRARSFYEETLGLDFEVAEGVATADVGGTDLRLVEPGPVPRGGLHVHYAFATPPERYDDWVTRLSESFDLEEHRFGSARSLYLDDPDAHCVEIGDVGPEGADEPLTGIFEVVLEVEHLARAESFYRRLGFEVVDRGTERRRIRLTGPMALELWEPQLGLADARGGVHVDLGFAAEDPIAVADAVEDLAASVEETDDGVVIRDRDGHAVTVVATAA
ncbi:MAG: VOC family protein [Halanaeroarchaeum sp.]